jgi:hypothetical protein
MLFDKIKVKGDVSIIVYDENMNVKEERFIPNLVVSSGTAWIASMCNAAGTVMDAIAIGTGTTAAAVTQTALVSENGRANLTSTTVSANVITYVATFGPGVGTGAVTEAGIFNSQTANSGTMLNRTTFSVINKGSSDTITISWSVTIQ